MASRAIAKSNTNDERLLRRIERALPAHVDPDDARKRLELIRNEKLASPSQLADECEAQARICRQFQKRLPNMEMIKDRDRLSEQLLLQEKHDHELAKEWRQRQLPYRWIEQFKIVWTWNKVWGGDLRPATLFPFYRAAYEFVFPGRPAPKKDALEAFLRSYKQFVGSIKLIGTLTVVGADGKIRPPELDAGTGRIAPENPRR